MLASLYLIAHFVAYFSVAVQYTCTIVDENIRGATCISDAVLTFKFHE